MHVLVTGATGFVGAAVCRVLGGKQHHVIAAVRSSQSAWLGACESVQIGDLTSTTCWSSVLNGVEAVVHCAARVHVMDEVDADPLAEFRRVNVNGTLHLAREAANAGVRRFVFISSIKVNGESTKDSDAFTESDSPHPEDPYGQSKAEAEEGLYKIATETGMEVVVVRPPLIYGPGVKGNFLNLLKFACTGIPLPFGAIKNQRSLVYLENLVSFVEAALIHPNAANQTFLISDGKDLSTADLLSLIRSSAGFSPRLLPVPVALFKFVGRITGKAAIVDRLCGSLRIDSLKARERLGWSPPFTVEEGIVNTVASFLNTSS